MSEFKGTPGPWRVDDNGVFYDIQTYSGINIGDVCASQHTFDESVHHGLVATANANLIAAAPELLEALQTLIYACTHGVSGCTARVKALRKSEKAISKALGDSR